MRNSLKIDVFMIKFIPWKKTEQYHILYLTRFKSESESENESETAGREIIKGQ
jgi:hypothetical protein